MARSRDVREGSPDTDIVRAVNSAATEVPGREQVIERLVLEDDAGLD